ncbi:MAG: TIGR03943 family putative permease subunit [Sarcina sp.]
MKRFNADQFVWFFILVVFSFLMTYLLLSGTLFMLVDKGRVISTSFMMIILYLITIVQATRIFTIPSRGGLRGGYVQYIAMIAILVIVSLVDIPKTSLNIKGVQLYHGEHVHGNIDTHKHIDLDESKSIYINSENFHNAIEELNKNIEKFIGKEIEIEGVYYNDSKYQDSFIITTLNMNCCVADTKYLGVLCDAIESNSIKNGESIKIKGTIGRFIDGDRELIKIENLEK